AVERFFQGNFEIVAKVGAARAAARAAARTGHAENAFENIRESRAEVRAEAMRMTGTAAVESGMAEAIIGRALLLVLQDVIGLVDFLEVPFAIVVARILVRVPLHG